MTTERPDDVDSPAAAEEPTEPAETRGPILASFQVRIHLRGLDPDGFHDPVPTVAELEDFLGRSLAIDAPGFTASISAERLDK